MHLTGKQEKHCKSGIRHLLVVWWCGFIWQQTYQQVRPLYGKKLPMWFMYVNLQLKTEIKSITQRLSPTDQIKQSFNQSINQRSKSEWIVSAVLGSIPFDSGQVVSGFVRIGKFSEEAPPLFQTTPSQMMMWLQQQQQQLRILLYALAAKKCSKVAPPRSVRLSTERLQSSTKITIWSGGDFRQYYRFGQAAYLGLAKNGVRLNVYTARLVVISHQQRA